MRIWTLDPIYPDRPGILSAWREGLLAINVIQGKTNGYKHHPQVTRFNGKLDVLCTYMHELAHEMMRRGYQPAQEKIPNTRTEYAVITRGQLEWERLHLLKKLKERKYIDADKIKLLERHKFPEVCRAFRIDDVSERMEWEKGQVYE